MTPRHPLTLNPSTRRARANRHRRLAFAALKLNSSLNVRMARYGKHIEMARQLESLRAGDHVESLYAKRSGLVMKIYPDGSAAVRWLDREPPICLAHERMPARLLMLKKSGVSQ